MLSLDLNPEDPQINERLQRINLQQNWSENSLMFFRYSKNFEEYRGSFGNDLFLFAEISKFYFAALHELGQ